MTCRDLTERLAAWRAGELPLRVRLSLQLHVMRDATATPTVNSRLI